MASRAPSWRGALWSPLRMWCWRGPCTSVRPLHQHRALQLGVGCAESTMHVHVSHRWRSVTRRVMIHLTQCQHQMHVQSFVEAKHALPGSSY